MGRPSAEAELGGPILPLAGVASHGTFANTFASELRDDRSQPAGQACDRNAEAATRPGRASLSFDAQPYARRPGNDGRNETVSEGVQRCNGQPARFIDLAGR